MTASDFVIANVSTPAFCVGKCGLERRCKCARLCVSVDVCLWRVCECIKERREYSSETSLFASMHVCWFFFQWEKWKGAYSVTASVDISAVTPLKDFYESLHCKH